jgi:hypothetical protein
MVDGDNVPGKRPDRLTVAGSQTGHDTPRSDVSAEDLEAGWQSWVMPYLEDSALGPVLIVIVIHVVAFMVPVILFAVVDRSIPAMAANVWLIYLSYKLLRADIAHNGHLGKISWLLISTWLLSFIAAYASVMTGLF